MQTVGEDVSRKAKRGFCAALTRLVQVNVVVEYCEGYQAIVEWVRGTTPVGLSLMS